jgi:hypothetical protein
MHPFIIRKLNSKAFGVFTISVFVLLILIFLTVPSHKITSLAVPLCNNKFFYKFCERIPENMCIFEDQIIEK